MSRVRSGFFAWVAVAAAGAMPACAQYPGHIDTEQPSATHLRATAVLEYTGDLHDIKESRLVPIAIWDGAQYQPGGLYLAQPAPLAVLTGTQYELESDGKAEGFFNVKDSEDLAGLWIGVGNFQAPAGPAPKRSAANSNHAYVIKDVDPDKPHFAHRPAQDTSQNGPGTTGNAGDSGPTLHSRPAGSGSGTDSDANEAPAKTASQPEVDPDRPTFHNRATKTQSAASNMPIDPDRPHLSYTDTTEQQKLAKPDALFGMPADMRQIAGISDSNPMDTQNFTFSWANPDDAPKMQAALEQAAEQAVAPSTPAPAPPKTTRTAHRRSAKPAAPPTPLLADEEFHVYSLTFGGGATMVLTAHTTTTPEQYVTIIAQPDFYGHAQILLKQVSTADGLDVTPRMLLVDAVDTEGNGRGDLLFELRGQTYRQFAIYRVAGGQASKVFVTQPTPLS
ncbi:MAG: hypothetical protein WA294_22795 [Acidobacteriaceae bacterium]